MKPSLTIGRHRIGPGNPVYLVAELSANHNQKFEQALLLLQAAKEAGADADLHSRHPHHSVGPGIFPGRRRDPVGRAESL
jgi:sialic acid synthase SpsE